MLVETGSRISVAVTKPATAAARSTPMGNQYASDSGELDSSMTMSTDSSTGPGRSDDSDSVHNMSLNSSLNDDHASLTQVHT